MARECRDIERHPFDHGSGRDFHTCFRSGNGHIPDPTARRGVDKRLGGLQAQAVDHAAGRGPQLHGTALENTGTTDHGTAGTLQQAKLRQAYHGRKLSLVDAQSPGTGKPLGVEAQLHHPVRGQLAGQVLLPFGRHHDLDGSAVRFAHLDTETGRGRNTGDRLSRETGQADHIVLHVAFGGLPAVAGILSGEGPGPTRGVVVQLLAEPDGLGHNFGFGTFDVSFGFCNILFDPRGLRLCPRNVAGGGDSTPG